DTNHHRVVALNPDGEENGFVLLARNDIVRAGHTWPVSFARGPLGNWWVLSADGRLVDADVIVYDLSGTPQKRINLPVTADPVFITQFAGGLVLTDREQFQLYYVDPRSGDVSHFRSPSFARVLSELRAHKLRFHAISTGALGLLSVLAIGGFVLGARVVMANQRKRRRYRAPTGPATAPKSRYQDVYWLQLEPAAAEFLRKTKRQLVIFAVAVAVLAIGGVIALAVLVADKLEVLQKCDPETLMQIGLLTVYLVVSLPIVFVFAFRALGGGIGTDGRMLYLADHKGGVLQVASEEAVYTSRLVAFEAFAVPLKLGNGRTLYAESEVAQRLKPLLTRAQRLGEINMMLYQLVNGHPLTLAFLVFISVGFAILFSTGLWRILL
ncbi:MAG: hypothetical protein ACE5LB_13250, partial [Acidiferrobacterales bacterium]